MGVKTVITQLVLHPKQNQDAASQANGQTENINEGKGFVAKQVSESDLEVIAQHIGVEWF
jgi:hypothetical protein